MAQWLGICLPVQGTWIRSLVQEIPHATEQLGPCATTAEPELWSLRVTTTEARAPGARALQRERPLQWEARAPRRGVAPARLN